MRLLYSEYKSDYDHYIFPYVIWAIPEAGDDPADCFARGFLPSSRNLDRFYMCRHIRVELAKFSPSSENRRILRKGENIKCSIMPRENFDYTPARREFCKAYADARFGQEVMSYERLDTLFVSPICTHLMSFREIETEREVGLVVLYLHPPQAAFYYYAFYDLNYLSRNLGMYMMTRVVADLAGQGFDYIYLGSCYSRNALYKTQFEGFQFWNGFSWSPDVQQLKYLIQRDSGSIEKHLLESPEFMQNFYPDGCFLQK
jgi:arginyl-tRNA--protein-N-Asp/Glu arginylyltransferase